jgi:hypothetical protein
MALPVRRNGLNQTNQGTQRAKVVKMIQECKKLSCVVFVVCDVITHSTFKDDILRLGNPFNLIDVVEQGSSDSQKSSFPRQMRLLKSGADSFC